MSDKKYCFRFTRDEIFMLGDVILMSCVIFDELRDKEWDDDEKQLLEKMRDKLLARRFKILQQETKEKPKEAPVVD